MTRTPGLSPWPKEKRARTQSPKPMRPAIRSMTAPATAHSRAARSSMALTRPASKVGLSHSTQGRRPASIVSVSNGRLAISMATRRWVPNAPTMIEDAAENHQETVMLDPTSVKALFFDVFGTVVDWRTSIARESEAMLAPKGYALDWLAFADAWRDEYQPAMEEVRSGKIPFSKLDVLHRRNLKRVLPRFKISSLEEATMQHLNRAWHQLDGWPDATEG